MFDLTLDCIDAVRVAGFWKVALGYEDEPAPEPFADRTEWLASFGEAYDPHEGAWLRDPAGVGPRLSILAVPEPKVAKNRMHVDVHPPLDPGLPGLASRLEALGGRRLGAPVVELLEDAGIWWQVMADPEGNEFCVVAEPGHPGPREWSDR